jgi:hypothetical protein
MRRPISASPHRMTAVPRSRESREREEVAMASQAVFRHARKRQNMGNYWGQRHNCAGQ